MIESIAFIIGFITFIVTIIMLFAEFNYRPDPDNENEDNILLFVILVAFFPSSAIKSKISKNADISNLTLIIDICYMVLFASIFIVCMDS